MRDTGSNGWSVRTSSDALLRGLRLAAVALGIGLVMTAGIARAEDDEDDNTSFEDKIIKNIIAGVGGTNMENQGIDYRERSPLVVPPRIDLPPPDASARVQVPNWPKDPDIAARKAAAETGGKYKTGETAIQSARALTPAEMAPKKVRKTSTANDQGVPGEPSKNFVLSPAQLGYNGGLFKNMFGGNNKGESVEFKGEPSRGELTQPPSGYQTPSPNYAYGTGPKEIMAQPDIIKGKY